MDLLSDNSPQRVGGEEGLGEEGKPRQKCLKYCYGNFLLKRDNKGVLFAQTERLDHALKKPDNLEENLSGHRSGLSFSSKICPSSDCGG
jgi:hypothetical protein